MPYTAVFDHARAGKGPGPGGKVFNPNDPADNPEAFGLRSDRVAAGPPGPPPPPGVPGPLSNNRGRSGDYEDAVPPPRGGGRHEKKPSREEIDFRRPPAAEAPPPRSNPYGNPAGGGNPYSEPPRRLGPESAPTRPAPEARPPPPRGGAPAGGAGGGGGPARTGSGSVNGVVGDRINGDGSSHGSSVGSGRADASPVHPQAYQQRFGRPGSNSPARGPGEPAFAPPTPTRSRMGPGGGRPSDTVSGGISVSRSRL